MKVTSFWGDACKYGAILGVIASASAIFEDYLINFSSVSLEAMGLIYIVELIAYTALFIYLVVRFTKRRALQFEGEEFTFGHGFSYSFVIVMLAMIVVGVAHTLFIEIMGFEEFIEGFLMRIDQMEKSIIENPDVADIMGGDMSADFEQIRLQIRMTTQPSILSNVFARVNSAAFITLILSTIIGFNMRSKSLK